MTRFLSVTCRARILVCLRSGNGIIIFGTVSCLVYRFFLKVALCVGDFLFYYPVITLSGVAFFFSSLYFLIITCLHEQKSEDRLFYACYLSYITFQNSRFHHFSKFLYFPRMTMKFTMTRDLFNARSGGHF